MALIEGLTTTKEEPGARERHDFSCLQHAEEFDGLLLVKNLRSKGAQCLGASDGFRITSGLERPLARSIPPCVRRFSRCSDESTHRDTKAWRHPCQTPSRYLRAELSPRWEMMAPACASRPPATTANSLSRGRLTAFVEAVQHPSSCLEAKESSFQKPFPPCR